MVCQQCDRRGSVASVYRRFARSGLPLVIFLLWPIALQAQSTRPLNPVILLPGILGSKLCDGQAVIWGDVLNTVHRFSELELPLDPAQNRLTPCGLVDQVQVFGPFRIGIYNSLLTALADLGFRKDQNLFIFDYDWRRSTLEGAVRLKDFIAHIRAQVLGYLPTKNSTSLLIAWVACLLGFLS